MQIHTVYSENLIDKMDLYNSTLDFNENVLVVGAPERTLRQASCLHIKRC